MVSDRVPIAPSNETRAFLDREHKLLIGGAWIAGEGRILEVENPARETPLATIRCASADQLEAAVDAARNALAGRWSKSGGRERGEMLLRFADVLEQKAEMLTEVMTLDNGSPLASSRMVVRHLALDVIRYYAGWATKIAGQSFTPNIGARPDTDLLVSTMREPVGVVGAIVPWNAPPGMIAMKLAPALAAGCALVLKTAEVAPLTGQVFAEAWQEAGGPHGVLNVLHGHGEDIGAAMAAHPGIDKIAFTGSTAVGRKITMAATGNLKKVSLELGGKSPVIILPDADLAVAIPAASMACYLSTGQQCMAGSRLFVHDSIYDQVVEGVAAHAAGLKVGDGMAPGSILGPMISARQKARVEEYVAIAKNEGAVTAFEAGPIPGPGHFLGPVLFSEVRPGMRIEQEEVFGPVLCVLRFVDEDELAAAVNGTTYALSGSVWTSNVQTALRIARRIDAGQVGINIHGAMSPETPFGGNRQSGWGRELGREGIDAYLKTKAVSIVIGPLP